MLALVLTEPAWVLGNAVGLWVIMLARAGFHGVYIEPVTIILYFMLVGGLVVSRLIASVKSRRLDEEDHAG